jgi:3-hydroxyacyl-CoA dehydrogenase
LKCETRNSNSEANSTNEIRNKPHGAVSKIAASDFESVSGLELMDSNLPRTSAPVRTIGILGAGLMGQSIALANARRAVAVGLTDVSPEALRRAEAHLRREVLPGWAPIQLTMSLSEVASSADVLLECIIEKAAAKQKWLAEAEKFAPAHAVLASNTSSIPISQLATALARPERFCGLHFCHPVRTRALVEVVRGTATSDETMQTSIQYVRAIGKEPIAVQDGPGFLLNRLLVLYLNEALALLQAGPSIPDIESAATAFGMPLGPFAQLDAFGIDLALRVGASLRKAFPDRIIVSELLVSLYQAGRLGVKSRAGFFRYDAEDAKPTVDRQVEEMICQHRRAQGRFTSEQIVVRLLLPILIEATRMVEEKRIACLSDVDQALVHGIAFPHGGLLKWANALGGARLLEAMEHHQTLGPRFQPSALLYRLARAEHGFYQP